MVNVIGNFASELRIFKRETRHGMRKRDVDRYVRLLFEEKGFKVHEETLKETREIGHREADWEVVEKLPEPYENNTEVPH